MNTWSDTRLLKLGFLLGKNINDDSVQNHLERLGYTYRIVQEDDNNFIISMDMRFNRLDIVIKNNKIVDF